MCAEPQRSVLLGTPNALQWHFENESPIAGRGPIGPEHLLSVT